MQMKYLIMVCIFYFMIILYSFSKILCDSSVKAYGNDNYTLSVGFSFYLLSLRQVHGFT